MAAKRSPWQVARGAESAYNSRLRQVARQIDHIVRGIAHDAGEALKPDVQHDILHSLREYARIIRPWARSVARFMVADVARRNERAWFEVGKQMGRALHVEIQQAPTGMLFQALQASQVELITSLPAQAADRVHALTQAGLVDSRRADDVAKAILATGDVTKARATLIARTEVSRTASNLTQARAQYAGSEGYVWHTSEDEAVRPTHRKMDGKYVRWGHPPKTDANLDPYHAGCGPNCRCFPEPIIPVFK